MRQKSKQRLKEEAEASFSLEVWMIAPHQHRWVGDRWYSTWSCKIRQRNSIFYTVVFLHRTICPAKLVGDWEEYVGSPLTFSFRSLQFRQPNLDLRRVFPSRTSEQDKGTGSDLVLCVVLLWVISWDGLKMLNKTSGEIDPHRPQSISPQSALAGCRMERDLIGCDLSCIDV